MYVYRQSSGKFGTPKGDLVERPDGSFEGFDIEVLAIGYSGAGHSPHTGRNNPDMEDQKGKGPIPRGRWIIGNAHTSSRVGPVAMHLTPVGHTAHGRTAFMIHGDDKENDASRGCIILVRRIREMISTSGITELLVIR